jgi:hypothetical protein
MPEREVQKVITFLGAKTEAGRDFDDRETVRFEIHGYVYEKGTRFLEDDDNPVQEYVKIQVTSIKEVG